MRPRSIAIAFLVVALLIVAATVYKKWKPSLERQLTDNIDSKPGNSSLPPFPTKEPKTYQARRIVTFNQTSTNADHSSAPQLTSRVVIARDGDRRREEHEAGALGTIVYLETAAGRFVMLPKSRLYAAQDDGTTNNGLTQLKVEPESMSPDFLLNESTVSTEYQKLGAEVRSGRATTKYRVITRSGNASIVSETLIWIDEILGMPVASELATSNSNGSTRISMELHDIRTEVESAAFALPADYRKVPMSQILSMIRPSGEAGGPQAVK
ncbi:MAG TPA: hypothetical protein VFR80_12300 [Pyrinomonadaceae bacterium]|nr:hypothetical protein [Pyrinomonadaceae bacterium]